jgi:hypothetical protein
MRAANGAARMALRGVASGWWGRGYWDGPTGTDVSLRAEGRGVNVPDKAPAETPVRVPVYLIQSRNRMKLLETALYFGRISVPFFLPLKMFLARLRSPCLMKNANQDTLNLRGGACVGRCDATAYLSKQFCLGLLILVASSCAPAAAQTNEWTWMGGSDTGA